MTRINLVNPVELNDSHLLAEHRELTRIPNNIIKGKYSLSGVPSEYVLGAGHVKFFYNRMGFLKRRYDALHTECLERGFNVQYRFPEGLPVELMGDYTPTEHALRINRERIIARWPKKARYNGQLL